MTESPKQADSRPQDKATSLADMIEVTQQPTLRQSFTYATLFKVLTIAALFVAVNWRQFPILVATWLHDVNWAHGFVIPLFSLYLLYARREELYSVRRRPCVWALPLVVFSIAAIVLSFYPIRTFWFCQLAMVALLFSLVLYLGGAQVIRITWLPIVFLVFAMPIPDRLYTQIAVPLQGFAARVSTIILQAVGVKIHVRASNLTIMSVAGNPYGLTVAEACSGVRSLMAYLALGVAWAYLENRPIWQRAILVASAVPIAILTNVGRVTITCSMYVLDHPELGSDFMHEFTGMLMLLPALAMFWGLGKLLQKLFVEVEEDVAAETPDHEGTSVDRAKA